MDFNYDSGIIDTVYILDSTQTPPATGSGIQNILSILGGAISLPISTNTVASPTNGMFRYNTGGWLEYYNSSTWITLTTGSGVTINNTTTNATYYPAFATTTSGSFSAANVSSTTLIFNPGVNSGTLTTGQFVSNITTGTSPFVVTSTTQVANLQAQYATNLYGGVAGAVHWQSAANTSGFTAAGTSNYLLQSNGTSVPTWTGSPTISGANFTAATIPIASLVSSSITIGSTSIALGATSTTLAGITGITFSSGTVTGVANPVNATDVVNLQYLQSVEAGLIWKIEVQAATTGSNVFTVTYANGTAGVGATLTNAGTQTAFTVDAGYTATVGDRVLIKNQATQTQNGIYVVTTVGSGSTNWVLTRSADANTPGGLDSATVFVVQGTTNANTSWVQTTANPTIGTNNIIFAQNYGLTGYTAGTGLSLTGNTFANTGVLTFSGGVTGLTPSSATAGAITLAGTLGVGYGGTGLSATPTNGQIDIGNGSTFTRSTITGTTNQVTVTNGTGTITLSLPAAVTLTTSLTVSGLTANSFLYSGTAGLLTTTTAPTNGQLLIGSTGAAPVVGSLAVTGTSFYITTGAGSITLQGPKFYSEYTTAPGTAPTATASQAVAIGSAAVANQYGGLIHASGAFSTAGDAQNGLYVLRNTTTNATPTEIFLDGSAADYIVPANFVVSFDVKVVCMNTAVTGAGAGFQIQGVIYRGATASTTAFIGTPALTILGRTPAGLTCSVTANTTTGALQIFVTGVASTTYHWVGRLETVEVGAS
jgi:hypothetical protein